MSKNKVRIKHNPREIILSGIGNLADAVASTLGASGRNVMIQSRETEQPHITKDGVTVARSIVFLDPSVDAAAAVLKSAAEKTGKEAGDGTTTTIVLAHEMVKQGYKSIDRGFNPMEMREGMALGARLVSGYIDDNKRECSIGNIYDIAHISSNGDRDIAAEVSATVNKVGRNGDMTIRPSLTGKTFTTVTEGAVMESGWASPYFADQGDKNEECTLEAPLIFLTNSDLTKVSDIEPVLSYASSLTKSDNAKKVSHLLIVAPEINGEAFSMALANTINPQIPLKICVATSPYMGERRHEVMEDISAVTGAPYFSDDKGLPVKKVYTMKDRAFGTCTRVVVGRDKTIFIGITRGEDYHMRLAELGMRIGADPETAAWVNKRLNMMEGSVAVIHVGGNSPAEVNERMDRFDDAICACRSALEEGVVPGGGVILLRAVEHLTNYLLRNTLSRGTAEGIRIVANALKSPFVTIMRNAGYKEGSTRGTIGSMIRRVMADEPEYGFNVLTGELVDMYDEGIIDPAKVLRVSLVNAVSVASMLLTTDCMVFDDLAYIEAIRLTNAIH